MEWINYHKFTNKQIESLVKSSTIGRYLIQHDFVHTNQNYPPSNQSTSVSRWYHKDSKLNLKTLHQFWNSTSLPKQTTKNLKARFVNLQILPIRERFMKSRNGNISQHSRTNHQAATITKLTSHLTEGSKLKKKTL